MNAQSVELATESARYDMSERSEVRKGNTELPPLTPAEQQVLEAITLSEEYQERLHLKFQQAIDDEAETCIDPNDKALIKTVASMIEWEWFANRGDPLPDGIVLTHLGALVPISKYTAANLQRIRSYLEDGALQATKNYRDDLMMNYEKYGEINEAFAAIARESDVYKLLRTIATDAPQAVDAPLSLITRMIRAAQIEGDVLKRHAVNRDDTLRLHPRAHQELQRGLYQLDDETERRDIRQPLDGRGRLLAFLVGEFNSHGYTDFETDADLGLIGSFYMQDGDVYARGINGKEIWVGGDRLCDFSTFVAEGISPVKGLEYFADTDFIAYYLLKKLLDPDEASKSALELLDDSCSGSGAPDVFTGRGNIDQRVLTYIRGVEAEIVKIQYNDEMRPSWVKASDESTIEVHDLEGLKREQNTAIGVISGRTYLAANHLMMGGNTQQINYPTVADHYDVKVELNGVVSGLFNADGLGFANRIGGVPYIPGLELIAVNKSEKINQYYFRRSDIDPYNGTAEVQLDQDRIQAVIDLCQNIGFTALADKLQNAERVSMSDLAEFTSQASDYTFNPKYQLYTDERVGFTRESFKELVDEHGRLQVQCTGAATFLKYMLSTALPGSHLATISGNVIEPDGVISASHHAQILVVHEGEQYIVDATPSLGPEYGLNSVRSGTNNGIFKSHAATSRERPKNIQHEVGDTHLQEEQGSDQLVVIDHTSDQRKAEVSKRLENITDRTKRLLKAHFDIPTSAADAKIYEKVVMLKKGTDPLRRVLELVLQWENGQDVSADLSQESVYLTNLIDTNRATLQKIGIPHYDKSLLTALLGIIEDLQA